MRCFIHGVRAEQMSFDPPLLILPPIVELLNPLIGVRWRHASTDSRPIGKLSPIFSCLFVTPKRRRNKFVAPETEFFKYRRHCHEQTNEHIDFHGRTSLPRG